MTAEDEAAVTERARKLPGRTWYPLTGTVAREGRAAVVRAAAAKPIIDPLAGPRDFTGPKLVSRAAAAALPRSSVLGPIELGAACPLLSQMAEQTSPQRSLLSLPGRWIIVP